MRQHLTCVVCLICLSNTITLTRVCWKMRPETKVRSIMNPQTRVPLIPIVDAYSKSLSEFASCPATIMTRLLYCNYEKSQRRKEGPGSQLGELSALHGCGFHKDDVDGNFDFYIESKYINESIYIKTIQAYCMNK